MDRRRFLSGAAAGGGLLLFGGGLWARQALARNRLRQKLVRAAAPVLTAKAHQELLTLPGQAREDMRRYFHGLCLNVHDFAEEVCAPEFADRLDERSAPEARQELVLLAFMRHVCTEEQLLNRVGDVAEAVGRALDRDWGACCTELANRWDLSVREYRAAVTADQLSQRLGPLVQGGLRQALDQARTAGQRPALGDAVANVGKSAVLMLPVCLRPPWLGWPLFAVLALRPVFDYFMGRVRDRSSDLQWAVTDKLSDLGNRVGSEFENEVRLRLADLHRWQDQAVEGAAGQQADELVRLL